MEVEAFCLASVRLPGDGRTRFMQCCNAMPKTCDRGGKSHFIPRALKLMRQLFAYVLKVS